MQSMVQRDINAKEAMAVGPAFRWWVVVLPAVMAIVGVLVAWAAVTTGQDSRRGREELQMNYDRLYWEHELSQAKQEGKPVAEIAEIEKIVAQNRAAKLISYARYGRQFTPWDGYRYEEIIDDGYVYQADKPGEPMQPMVDTGGPEMRSKNVVWYPLYPLLASGLMWWVPALTSTNALTAVSWMCCLLGAVVMFLYLRKYYFLRERLELRGPAEGGNLARHDAAAMWAVAAMLFSPCAVFLYANFTESLFVLLLALFLYCVQARWWWRAVLVAAVASACRSQGVLFGPILGLVFLLRGPGPVWKRLAVLPLMGVAAEVGVAAYAAFLWRMFGDPLAFMHAQKYWNVGISWDRIVYAADPANALSRVFWFAYYKGGEVDWPRLWESLCLIWPPVVLAIWGWRYLTLELLIVGWMMWGLPYVSNSKAGNPPFDSQWMSMGRFMSVVIPLYVIFGGMFERRRWAGLLFMAVWAAAFGVFAYKYGTGAWVG